MAYEIPYDSNYGEWYGTPQDVTRLSAMLEQSLDEDGYPIGIITASWNMPDNGGTFVAQLSTDGTEYHIAETNIRQNSVILVVEPNTDYYLKIITVLGSQQSSGVVSSLLSSGVTIVPPTPTVVAVQGGMQINVGSVPFGYNAVISISDGTDTTVLYTTNMITIYNCDAGTYSVSTAYSNASNDVGASSSAVSVTVSELATADDYVEKTSADYIKSASVSNDTLTLTKGDDTTVTFTPSGGGGGGSYTAGDGIDITNDVISLETASANDIGGVKVGSGLSIDANGVLSAIGGGGGSSGEVVVLWEDNNGWKSNVNNGVIILNDSYKNYDFIAFNVSIPQESPTSNSPILNNCVVLRKSIDDSTVGKFALTGYGTRSLHFVVVSDTSLRCTVNENNMTAYKIYGIKIGGSGSGGGSYTAGDGIDITNDIISLETASANDIGGVKVGTNLSIDGNGVLSATDTTYTDFVGSGASASSGLVPAPPTTAGATKFLCEDGSWSVPAGGGGGGGSCIPDYSQAQTIPLISQPTTTLTTTIISADGMVRLYAENSNSGYTIFFYINGVEVAKEAAWTKTTIDKDIFVAQGDVLGVKTDGGSAWKNCTITFYPFR